MGASISTGLCEMGASEVIASCSGDKFVDFDSCMIDPREWNK